MSPNPAQPETFVLNPFDGATEGELRALLAAMCSHGVSRDDASELEDQLEALVPALIELRDQGHVVLHPASVAAAGTFGGFSALATDRRLSPLARQRCAAIRDRIAAAMVRGVHRQLFG